VALFNLEIITAEQVVFTGEVNSLTAPASEGEIGVLPRHVPILTVLNPGELRYSTSESQQHLVVSGGFLEVKPDKVVVLVDSAERLEEIDEERAQMAIQRAKDRLVDKSVDLDLERALSSLRRASARLDLVRKRRQRGPGVPQG